ncbi:MAG: c-type cytochrome domain-containing protein [Pirellulaceae bacterium]
MSSKFLSWSMIFASAVLFAVPSVGEETEPGKEKEEVEKVTYEEHVKPIFREHCLTCHDQGDAKGGLVLSSYAGLMEGGGSGEIVYEGDALSSRLWQLITHEDTPVMPPEQDKLADAKLAVIKAWIDGGLLENSGSKVKKKKKSALAFEGSASGKPDGPAALPETVPMQPVSVGIRTSAIPAMAASPWAPLVAIGGLRQILLYNTETAELAGVIPFPEGVPQSLRFSRNGAYLVAGGGEHSVLGIAAIYDVKTGDRLAVVGDELDTVFGADVNDSMTRVALGGPKRMLRIYDVSDGELLFDIKKHTDWIYDVAFSPDGVLVASADRSAGLFVWEAETGRLYLSLTDHKGAIRSIAWRDDSNVLASASEDGTVKIWDMIEGKAIKSISAHGGGATAVAFDHEGRLVTSGMDRQIKLWDPAGNPVRSFPAMPEQALEVAITHDGKQVIGGDWTGKVVAWNSEDPKQAVEISSNPPKLEEQLKAAEAKVAESLKVVQADEAATARLVKKLADATSKKEQLLAEQKQKVATADKARASKDAANKQVTQRTSERDSALQTVAQRQKDVDAARKRLQDNPDSEPEVAKVEKELAAQLTALAAKREEVAKVRQEMAQHAKSETEQRKAAEAMSEAIAAAETAIGEAKKQRDEASGKLAASKAAHETAVAGAKRIADALAAFQAEQKELAQAAEKADDDEAGQRLKERAELFLSVYSQ